MAVYQGEEGDTAGEDGVYLGEGEEPYQGVVGWPHQGGGVAPHLEGGHPGVEGPGRGKRGHLWTLLPRSL